MNVAVDQYAVMGNPIKHSKSPIIHALFAEQTGERLRYEALLVPTDGFGEAVELFYQDKGCGLNITVPFKQDAWNAAERMTGRARRAGAVNTLWKDETGTLWGDTTDGVGLVRDLTENNGVTLSKKRVLILGAGGAVRGVLEPILEQGSAEVVIANRTVSRAEELAKLFGELGKVSACGFTEVEREFDVVINGTSASLEGECPPLPDSAITAQTAVYDMMYGAGDTVFNSWAKSRGAEKVMDGLGMLVEQAAESFSIWRNKRPDTQPVIQMLRNELI
ncbi:shikimate dehydrogenase [Sansalvadorimonas verongulae]|uniref:shikimate dehydrogenase n=1 Tax=Sansalvadorimonas verongulae TaxID=2172824 RepID=UPI0012BBD15C|nr:shikimate dehydrogenase [Sansalvadorimonas verongulae]MTI14194.1 shikimate dehydrogenase [Sansalvadorimonas verongulae]